MAESTKPRLGPEDEELEQEEEVWEGEGGPPAPDNDDDLDDGDDDLEEEEEVWEGEGGAPGDLDEDDWADDEDHELEEEEEVWEEEGGRAALVAIPEGFRSGFVAVVGRPNVGKSTLVNALVGQKVAIVSSKPQTTRRRLLGVRTADASQTVFVDTPGIHKPFHKLGEFMVDEAVQSIPDADVIIFVVDVADRPRDEDRDIAALLTEKASAPIVLALNKADAVKPAHLQENYAGYVAFVPGAVEMLVSARRGDNLDRLVALVEARLPEGPLYFPADQVTDQSEQLIAAELIREAVLHLTEAEVPHSVAVAIQEWQERGPNLTYIDATVMVERDSQKAIVIGKGGSMLREIGRRARQEIEAMLGRKVFLELFVKVREDWRRDSRQLRRLGFTPEA